MVRITCLGAAGSVTGSCYLVESPSMKKNHGGLRAFSGWETDGKP